MIQMTNIKNEGEKETHENVGRTLKILQLFKGQ